ncbi:MAG: hypothetical protein IIC70_09055 [Acidobacteria bacterium]|nr:hypothetical protein [Acidobacteriota bacterium]
MNVTVFVSGAGATAVSQTGPEPSEQREVCGVDKGEAASFVSGGFANKYGEEHDQTEDQHKLGDGPRRDVVGNRAAAAAITTT